MLEDENAIRVHQTHSGKKYLPLPEGLNALEELLKSEMGRMAHGDKIHSVFNEFKRGQGL
jgi:hypothetical protein